MTSFPSISFVYIQFDYFKILVIFSADPLHQKINDFLLLQRGQFFVFRNPVPFIEASSAAARTGMLSQKYRMPFHRCLLSIIFRFSRRKPFPYKILTVPADRIHTFFIYVFNIPFFQMKGRAEFRTGQSFQRFIDCHFTLRLDSTKLFVQMLAIRYRLFYNRECFTAAVVKLVNTLDCGSSIRGFESLQPPVKNENRRQCGFLFFGPLYREEL